MKRTTLLILIFLTASISISHAQKKEKIKGDRNVKFIQTPIESYNTVEIGGDMEIFLVQGETTMVEVEADENLHEVIQFNVINNILTVQTTKRITSKKALNIRIYHTAILSKIVAKDDAIIKSLNDINLKQLHLSTTNTSKIYLTLNVEDFTFSASDKSRAELNLTAAKASFTLSDDIKIKALINADQSKIDMYREAHATIEGDVDKLDLRMDNSAYFMGENFTAKRGNLITESRAEAYINVSKALSLKASDKSETYIYNTPRLEVNAFEGNAILYKKD